MLRPTPAGFTAPRRHLPELLAVVALLGLCTGAAAQPAADPVPVDLGRVSAGAKTDEGDTVALKGRWWPAPGDGPRPTVLALHGCGGLWRADGVTLDPRYPAYAARLHAAGWHVLLPDSLRSRGSGPICSQAPDGRRITPALRREDVRAALRWLDAQPQVQRGRTVVLGWSHGAMTALELLAADPARERGEAGPEPAGVVTFYPGCGAWRDRLPQARQPVLMLLGGADDWTTPGPCEALVRRWRAADPALDLRLEVYPGAYHGFDGTGPVRLRRDVKHGRHAEGVHVGGDPAARAAALEALDAFLAARR